MLRTVQELNPEYHIVFSLKTNTYHKVEQNLEQDKEQLEEVTLLLEDSEPRLQMQRESQQVANSGLQEAEQAMQEWQSSWEDYRRIRASII